MGLLLDAPPCLFKDLNEPCPLLYVAYVIGKSDEYFSDRLSVNGDPNAGSMPSIPFSQVVRGLIALEKAL